MVLVPISVMSVPVKNIWSTDIILVLVLVQYTNIGNIGIPVERYVDQSLLL